MAERKATLTIYNTALEEATGVALTDAFDGLEVQNGVDPLYVRNLLEGALGIATKSLAEDIEITSGGTWSDDATYARAIVAGSERVAKLSRLLVAALDPAEVPNGGRP
jgi:hypothetical protein